MWLVKSNYGEPFGCRKRRLVGRKLKEFPAYFIIEPSKNPGSFLMRQNWLGFECCRRFWPQYVCMTPVVSMLGSWLLHHRRGAYPVTPSERRREKRGQLRDSSSPISSVQADVSWWAKKHMDKPYDTKNCIQVLDETYEKNEWVPPYN